MSNQSTRYLTRSTAPKYFSDIQIRTFHDPNARHHPGTHSGTILRTVAWNNLGSRIATGGAGGNVKIWNPEKADLRSRGFGSGQVLGLQKSVFNITLDHNFELAAFSYFYRRELFFFFWDGSD
ncbi:hypothetical protein AA313_de0204434 [Arthrobotrys entomopaga]|nr:hypothetical protein AA313_de0204434 [Arthrobotrys entomopaga]